MLKTSTKLTSLALLSTALSAAAFAGSPRQMPELLPSNPGAGECYARVTIPAQYRSGTETVLTKNAYVDYQVTEPKLSSRQEQVLVKEASVHYKVRQPTYKSVTDQIMVRPSYERLSVSPPQFNTVKETIRVSKPHLVWKKGNPTTLRAEGYIVHSTADAGRSGRGYQSAKDYGRAQAENTLCGPSCEIWCLVEAPGQTVTYDRTVMTSPSDVHRIVVPAKYNVITRQVVADRGGVEEVAFPAEYRAITIEDVVTPASVHRVQSPPKYADIAKKVLISPERYEWRRVVCVPGTQAPATGARVSQSRHSYSGTVMQKQPLAKTASASAMTSRYQPRVYGQMTTRQSTSYTSGTQPAVGAVQPSQNQLALRGSQALPVATETYQYGSDLPTYSEDYTKPSKSKRRRRRR